MASVVDIEQVANAKRSDDDNESFDGIEE